jgi:mRNA-degrading endonuclease RelE of RelBE toxin-antitoxin system
MKYELEIKDQVKAVLKLLPDDLRREIGFRPHLLQQDFSGDVKKLQGSRNEYRLRVGRFRVLFELDGEANCDLYYRPAKRHLSMSTTAIKQKTFPTRVRDLNRQVAEAKAVLRRLRDTLEDLDDRRELARAKKKNGGKAGTSWDAVKKEFDFKF